MSIKRTILQVNYSAQQNYHNHMYTHQHVFRYNTDTVNNNVFSNYSDICLFGRYQPTIPKVRYSEDPLFGLGLGVRVACVRNIGPESFRLRGKADVNIIVA